MEMSLTSTLPVNSPEYLAKFGGHCPQVTENRVPVLGNYVINQSFESAPTDSGLPLEWLDGKYNVSPGDAVDCQTARTGKCSFYFGPENADPKKYVRRVVQVIPYRGTEGTRITFSGWSKARNVIDKYPPLAGPLYGIGLELFDDKGVSIVMPTEWDYRQYSAEFSLGTHDFEFAESSFISPVNFTCAEVFYFFDEDGEVWMDDARVTFVPPEM